MNIKLVTLHVFTSWCEASQMIDMLVKEQFDEDTSTRFKAILDEAYLYIRDHMRQLHVSEFGDSELSKGDL